MTNYNQGFHRWKQIKKNEFLALQVGETGAFLARGNFSQLTFELVNLTLEK